MSKIIRGFEPVYNKDCEILILGSMPSEVSRENNFYYANPSNRFWRVLSKIYGDDFANADVETKKQLLFKHKIALFDVYSSCVMKKDGSSLDSDIRQQKMNDIPGLVEGTKIRRIFVTSQKAYDDLIKAFGGTICGARVEYLPSPSGANKRIYKAVDDLAAAWKNAILGENDDKKHAKRPKTQVYVAKIADFEGNDDMPSFAREELARSGDPKVKSQKRAAYGLLKYALERAGEEVDFSSHFKRGGKPYAAGYFYSFSHSNGLVAVALSWAEVGVDIELVRPRDVERLKPLICTKEEMGHIDDIYKLTALWTKKEAYFKSLGKDRFVANLLDLGGAHLTTREVVHEKKTYFLSVQSVDDAEIFDLLRR